MNLNTIKRLMSVLVLTTSLVAAGATGAASKSSPLTTCAQTREPCFAIGPLRDAQRATPKPRSLVTPRRTADGEIWQAGGHFLR